MDELQRLSVGEVYWLSVAVNASVFAGSVVLCWLTGVLFHADRLFDRWEPMRPVEVLASIASVFLNAGVALGGWIMWSRGMISISQSGFIASMVDLSVMIVCLDVGMYLSHRLAHVPVAYRLVHKFHHRHVATNPISLFVLHPIEIVGFGLLMIAFLSVYSMSIGGLVAYLVLNIVFGTIAHTGVEPFPKYMKSIPILGLIGSSSFHANHHKHPESNFGFYSEIWDRLFGTVHEDGK